MPYTFIEIEKKKNWQIGFLFLFLIIFYFFIAWLVSFIINKFVLPSFETSITALAIAFVLALFHWLFSTYNLLDRLTNALEAIMPDPKDRYHKEFINIVDEVKVATGGKQMKPMIIPSLALNAFAMSDFSGNSIIGVTEGLLARLNRQQLEAVIGHEAAHIVTGDSLLSTVSSALFDVYATIIASYSKIRIGIFRSVYAFISYMVICLAQFISLLIHMLISRQKEYRADAIAVRLTRNPVGMAEALHIISRNWRGATLSTENLESLFIMNPKYSELDERDGFFSDLFSTHPPVKKRIGILTDMAHVSPITIEKTDGRSQANVTETPVFDETNTRILCPNCGQPFMEVSFVSVNILKCRFCNGHLVEENKMVRLYARKTDKFSESIIETGELIRRSYTYTYRELYESRNLGIPNKCPKCNTKMLRNCYKYVYPILVDHCFSCNLLWFDKDELELALYLMNTRNSLY